MYLRSISALAVITALGACGGSSDGSAVNPVRSVPVPEPVPVPAPTVLASFADGSGVLRSPVALTDSTFETVVCSPCADVANFVTSGVDAKVSGAYFNGVAITITGREVSVSPPAGLDIQSEAILATLTINGETINALAVYDMVSGSYIIQTPSELIAGGSKFLSIPLTPATGGTTQVYRYTGSNVAVYRDQSGTEYGDFIMEVDFDAGTATITATTTGVNLNGSLIVNNQNGTFSGNALSLQGQPASMEGNFHGDQAVGVSGVYYDNTQNPTITGAIAGRRDTASE